MALALAIAVTGALFAQRAPAVEDALQVRANRFEAKMLDRLNALRARRGLAPLTLSAGLSAAAHHHSTDMARRGSCDHVSTKGASFFARLSRFYWPVSGWEAWAAAENVLCYPRRLTVAAALGQWLRSPGHRANLLSAQWRDVGLGAVYTEPAALDYQDALYVTAAFGVRR